MNRREFLRSLPVLPLVAWAEGAKLPDPERDRHADVLDRHDRMRAGVPLGGDEHSPSLVEVTRALSYFARRPR